MDKLKNNLFLSVCRTMVVRYFKDRVPQASAELAYYLLFSIFPLMIFINSAISMFNISINEMLNTLEQILPIEIFKIITDYISYASGLQSATLLYSGLFLTVYMLSRAVKSLMYSVMRAYRVKRKGLIHAARSIVFSVLLLLSLIILLALYMVSGELLETLSEYINLSPGFIYMWQLMQRALAPVFLFFMLTLFYYAIGRETHSFAGAMPGAAFSLIIWTVATMGFSYYIKNINSYSALYGSIGAIMILMLWLYLTGLVLIMGGELNHVIVTEKNRRKRREIWL